jgi:hypothetical protein
MKQYEFHSTEGYDKFTNAGETPLAEAKRHSVYADRAHAFNEEPKGRKHYAELETKSAVFNDRDDELAYVSSDIYDLIQHHEVFDAVKTAVDATVGEIDFGMIRDYGARVDGVVVFGNQSEANIDMRELLGDSYIPPEGRPDTDPTAEDSRWRDSVGLGMRFRNSFDGDTKIGGSTMGYRYICQNWLVWDEAEIGSVERSHTRSRDAEDGIEPDFFVDIITDVFEVREQVESLLTEAAETEVPLTWVPGVLEQNNFGENYQKRITGRVLAQDSGSRSEDETSMWNVYNATTAELDRNTAESSGKTYDYYQSYAWGMLDSEIGEIEEPTEDMSELRDFAIAP